MCQKFTPDELNRMDHQSKNNIIFQMQNRLDKLEHDYENLIEQDLMIEVSRDGWRKIFGRSDPYTFRESELNDWFAEQKNG